MKKYKNIHGSEISVCLIKRGIDEVFEADEKLQEIKNLVRRGYIEEAKKDE